MEYSRLVVPDQVKAEREAAIVDRAIEQAFAGPARGRWARPLGETARLFQATAPGEPAALARAAAAARRDEAPPAESLPLVRATAARGLDLGGEVALGRLKAAEVSRPAAPRGQ